MEPWKWVFLALVAGLAVVFVLHGPERVPVVAPAREVEVTFSHRGITLAGQRPDEATAAQQRAVLDLVVG